MGDSDLARLMAPLYDLLLADCGRMAGEGKAGTRLPAKLVRPLLFLYRHRELRITVSSLADSLGVSLGWASRITDELEAAGLIERKRHPSDRRVVTLTLTDKAITLNADLWAHRERSIGTTLAALDATASPDFYRLLAEAVSILTA